MEKLIITPKTKIFDLLQVYPQLEDTLVAIAPPFKKLKNPVLRNTITKITTLAQAALIGGVKTEELINKLRAEVGQSASDIFNEVENKYITQQPDWFIESAVTGTIDIRVMLDVGEQPVYEVLSGLKKLDDDQILKVIAPFIPAPLIDKALSLNIQHWIVRKLAEEYWIFFKK